MAIARSQFITALATSASSVSAVFSSAVSSGNSILVWVGNFTAAQPNGAFSTLVDNVNNAGFTQRIFSTMSNAADTSAHLGMLDKLNLSSGAAASTYRIEARLVGASAAAISFCAVEYSGGPFVFGSTASANGTSSSPAGGALTASSSPALFVGGAVHNSTAGFASTATGGGAVYVTTVDPTNTGQVLNVVEAVAPSSLAENLGHSLTSSTRWLAGLVVYTGLGSGGAAASVSPWVGCLSGIQ